mmetsp:Transcript_2085/g.2861  ORF Transcript_2085/g.2861 Transcript_2085/m.2861 type:complete len:181 (+) Transcript_2085:211-753(+)
MTRAFSPPETLSNDDIKTIADVRRNIWTNSFYGLGYGSLAGLVGHSVAQFASGRGLLPGVRLNRNTLTMSFLAGGALGSFLMATATGKNEVHNLHPIFDIGKKEEHDNITQTEYQKSLSQAKQNHFTEIRRKANAPPFMVSNPDDREELHQNRVLRRRTLQNSFKSGSGLSDAHGGQWTK